MRILIAIPHIFNPTRNSLYSSQNEEKRDAKREALRRATIGNAMRHGKDFYVHESTGQPRRIITRKNQINSNVEIDIQVYTNKGYSLMDGTMNGENIEIINTEEISNMQIPDYTSQKLLEQAEDYDILCYMEDDIAIEDPEFFDKISYIHKILPVEYCLIPHRCEYIPNKGDVILSGDPDSRRKDLFWDTGEAVEINWPTGRKIIYRAINPHSGCFFLSQKQALAVRGYWQKVSWKSEFQLSGPLEQAGSGRLLPVLKIMKPIVKDYRFFMVRHKDNLWVRHEFEEV